MCSWCLEKPEESVGSPGVGSHVRVRCEPSSIGAGNQIQPLEEQQVLSITEPSDQMTGWGVWGGEGGLPSLCKVNTSLWCPGKGFLLFPWSGLSGEFLGLNSLV